MDPLSVTASTAALIKFVSFTSLTLYTFIDEAINVDQNVRDLASEVEALKQTLVQVDSILKEPSITSAEQRITTNKGTQLWTTLYECLEECQVTVVRLDSALDGVRKKQPNWAKQVLRQIKLNLGKDEINSLRNQIHTHSIALNTALQMANIRATYSTPGVIIDDLGPRIGSLQQSLDLMMASLKNLKSDSSNVADGAVPKSLSMKKLHSLGNRILAEATTIYASSVGSGSVYGEQSANDVLHRTMNWIPEPAYDNRTPSMGSVTLPGTDQTASSGLHNSTDAATRSQYTTSSQDDTVDSDSDGEFEVELAQRLFEKGKAAYQSADYRGALGFLQKSVVTFNQLPHELKLQLNLAEVPLAIATCKFYLQEIDEASNDLIALVQKESTSHQDAIQKCQISHLLAQICLIKGENEAAEKYCRNSLKGRRRVLGKDHKDYFASLALLSEIHLIRGKVEEAAVFQDMLPAENKNSEEKIWLKALMLARKTSEVMADNTTKPRNPCVTPLPRDSSPNTSVYHNLPQTRCKFNAKKLEAHTGFVLGLAFCPSHSLLASASADGTVRLWNLETCEQIWKSEDHSTWIWTVAFSPDGSLIASGSHNNTVKVWNWATGHEIRRFSGHSEPVRKIAFSPNGVLLASASNDNKVWLWDCASNTVMHKFEGRTSLAFSPNGSLLASASCDETVRLWNPDSGREICQLIGPTVPLMSVAFSSNGELLAAATYDGTISLWDLNQNREIRRLLGHAKLVTSVAFSPTESSLLVSASDDATVRLWDANTGEEIERFEAHTNITNQVAFSPNGSCIASAGDDNLIHLWTRV